MKVIILREYKQKYVPACIWTTDTKITVTAQLKDSKQISEKIQQN